MTKIFLGYDHAGFNIASKVAEILENRGCAVVDLGPKSAERVDYPDYAQAVCKALLAEISNLESSGGFGVESGVDSSVDSSFDSGADSNFDSSTARVFGVLICGSGVGMSMAANRFVGIRAALCASTYTAAMSRAHNDANVICLGERVSGLGEIESMLDAFLTTEFQSGRHKNRIEKF